MIMMGDEKIYKCCPFCESKNIEESTEIYYPEMERLSVEYQLGRCLDCDESWNNV